MNNQKVEKNLGELSLAVGDFIRYWGFRRIHGQIWTQIYLSKKPLSGSELTKKLQVSKALVSPALSELESHDLIQQKGGDAKTKRYTANPDVYGVIRKVLETREKVFIQKAMDAFEKLDKSSLKGKESPLDSERVAKLGMMIQSAQSALDLVVQLGHEDQVEKWRELL